ncbi:hypothetical protein [Lacinutrix chionoecetis]
MKYLNILIVLLVLFNCKNEGNSTDEINNNAVDSTRITKEDISKINYIDYGIDSKAKKTLDSWEAYNTVFRAIEAVKEGDFNYFKADDEVFNTTLKDLETTIPFTINSEPIKARLLILKTKLLKFREAVSLNTISKRERLIAIKELLQSFSYVTLQINKKFEKEAQNIIKPDSL